MKGIVFLCTLFLGFFLNTTHAQKDYGPIKTEERSVGSFDGIRVSDGIDVYIRQGNTTELMVKANESIIDEIITEVKENTLVIKRDDQDRKRRNWSWGNRRQAVYVTLQDFERLSTSGGSDVFTEKLKLDNLEIRSSGGSDIELEIEANELVFYTSGGSDVDVEGTVKDMYAKTSGGSDLNARKLKAVNCEISTSGGSDANIYVTGKLSMIASGASDISYSGPAEVVMKKSSGAADISKN